MDIFFFEAFKEEEKALRRHLPEEIQAGFTPLTAQEDGGAELPAPVISVRTQSVLPVAWAGVIKGILTRSTGYDHVKRYREMCGKKIPAGWLPLYCNRAVAEQAFLMALALSRKLLRQMECFHTFHRDGLTGAELSGKKLVVAGVGNIGYEMVKIGRGLGMKVFGVDIVRRHEDVAYLPPEEALPQADIVMAAMNLTGDNQGYFGRGRLLSLKPGALFINVARGEFSPCPALLSLLEEGHLGGVGLDVYADEPDLAEALRSGRCESEKTEIQAALALARHPDAILTPHNAFNTAEAVERKARQTVDQFLHFRQTGAMLWPVGPGGS